MTLNDISDQIKSKIILAIVGIAITASTGFLTQSYNEQDASNKKVLTALDDVHVVLHSIQKSSFDDKITDLKKQSYKMEFDEGDVRPMDVASSANFCTSSLYKKFIDDVSGSELIEISQSCQDVNLWVKAH